MISVIINGTMQNISEPSTAEALITKLGLKNGPFAVEINKYASASSPIEGTFS